MSSVPMPIPYCFQFQVRTATGLQLQIRQIFQETGSFRVSKIIDLSLEPFFFSIKE